MKDYYNLFIKLSLQQCIKNNYSNILEVKKHNAASKKLDKLKNEMKQNVSEDILYMLLNYEDDRVKVNAASLCLQMNVLVDQAVLTLKNIIDFSDNTTICFSAKMLLKSVNN